MSGIGGRAPRHLPVWPPLGPTAWPHQPEDVHRMRVDLAPVKPIGHVHRHADLLGPWPYGALPPRHPSVPAPDPNAWREAAARRELVVKARHVAAALRREQQRQARIAAGVDRSSPDAGPRPRWSR